MTNENQIREVATVIHMHTCKKNHVDDCGWDWDSWEDPSKDRKYYVARAKETISRCQDLNLNIENTMLLLNEIFS